MQYILCPFGFFIAAVLLISVTISGKKSIKNRIIRLVIADIIATLAILFSPYQMHGSYSIPALMFLLLNVIAFNKLLSPEKPEQAIYDAWHDNPDNWRWKVFYYNPDDHRIFPPKKLEGAGWTINFANIYSILVMIVCILLISFISTYLS